MSESELNTISMQNLRAKEAAQIALEKLKVQPTSLLEYRSAGRVAVIGGEQAIELAPRLSGALHPQVILTGGCGNGFNTLAFEDSTAETLRAIASLASI
jgi:hypothetical protein